MIRYLSPGSNATNAETVVEGLTPVSASPWVNKADDPCFCMLSWFAPATFPSSTSFTLYREPSVVKTSSVSSRDWAAATICNDIVSEGHPTSPSSAITGYPSAARALKLIPLV